MYELHIEDQASFFNFLRMPPEMFDGQHLMQMAGSWTSLKSLLGISPVHGLFPCLLVA